MDNTHKKQISVLYNSACPVCNAGIRRERNRMQNSGVRWRDIHTEPGVLDNTGLEKEFVRQRLHVVDDAGNQYIGIDAFIALWNASPAQAWKARLFSFPVIHRLSVVAYNVFAWLLYKFNRLLKRW